MQPFEPLTMPRGVTKTGSPTSSSSSASRQKSCNACVRGKRRCDKTAPRCTRCAAKGLECVYQRVPPGSSPSAVTLAHASTRASLSASISTASTSSSSSSSSPTKNITTMAASLSSASSASRHAPVGTELTDDDFEMGGFDVSDLATVYGQPQQHHIHHQHQHHHHHHQHHLGAGNSTSTASSSPELALDPSLEFSIADLLGASSCSSTTTGSGACTNTMTTPEADSSSTSASMASLWSLPGFAEPKADFPTLSQSFPFPDPSFEPSSHPPTTTATATSCSSSPSQHQQPGQQVIRDVAVLNEHRTAGKCFAIDPLLVHDPRSSIGYMFQTFTTLHLDFVRTRALPFAHPRLYAANVPRTIMAAYCGAAAYSSRSPATRAWAYKAVQDAAVEVRREGLLASTPTEKLARCHALFIIESIRVFDGDLGLRYAAEREMNTLSDWSYELLELLGGDTLTRPAREQSPATWETWIFEESAKRTVSVGLAFQCFFSILRSEPPDPNIMTKNIPYTASQHLWGATTSVDFFRAWREQPRWTIQNFDFKEFWQCARPEDMDDFTRMMLTVQSSPDAVDHFMQGDTTIPVRPMPCAG